MIIINKDIITYYMCDICGGRWTSENKYNDILISTHRVHCPHCGHTSKPIEGYIPNE